MRSLWMTLIAIGASALCTTAQAADLAPGLWEIRLENRVANQPGFAPQPFRLTQCLNAADAQDPSALLGGLANPGASDCTYADKTYSGNTFRFSMQCAGSFAIRSQGEVSFTADTMKGTINTVADVGAEKLKLGNKISARRLGGC